MSEVKLNALCTELHNVEWQTLAEKLGVPSVQIRTVLLDNPHSTGRCRLEVLDWWMKNGKEISWVHVAVALRNMYQDHLAERIVRKYCSGIGMEAAGDSCKFATFCVFLLVTLGSNLLSDGGAHTICRAVRVDCEVVECLLKLKYDFGEMTSQLYQLILAYLRRNPFSRRRKMNEFIITLSTFLGKENHRSAEFGKIYNELVRANDMFQVKIFKLFVQQYFKKQPSYLNTGNEYIRIYELKKHSFLQATTLQQFRDAVLKAVPHGLTETRYDHLTLILSEDWSNCALKALELLLFKVFGVHKSVFLDIKITYGSLVVDWKFLAYLRPILAELVVKNLDILKENNVIEISIGGETLYSQERSQEIQLPVAVSSAMQAPSHITLENAGSSTSEGSEGFEALPFPLSHTSDYLSPFHVQGTEFESKIDSRFGRQRSYTLTHQDSGLESNILTRGTSTQSAFEFKEEKNKLDDGVSVPLVAVKEFRKILMSERSVFQQQMQQMILTETLQNSFISELKEEISHLRSDILAIRSELTSLRDQVQNR